jgi:hypothetical protein
MASELIQHITDTPIMTKIADLEKMAIELPKNKLVEKIQAVTTELILLQFKMREHAVLDWYTKLNDRQKLLHLFFEENIDSMKLKANSDNWVVISDTWFESENIVKNIEKYNDHEIWVGFIDTSDNVEKATCEYHNDELDCMLFSPLFSINK